MKIGILTFHRVINYGAALQLHSLFSYLEGLGHDVSVIDYRPSYLPLNSRSGPHRLFPPKRGLVHPVKYLRGIIHNAEPYSRYLKFASFLRKSFKFTESFHDPDHFSRIADQFDAIIVGSDQIWNPELTGGDYDPVFFAHPAGPKVKRIAYAASFGGWDGLKLEHQKLEAYLSAFDGLSIREQKTLEAVRDSMGLSPEYVVDPVLLPNSFEDLAAVRAIPHDYCLVYLVTGGEDLVKKAAEIAQCNGIKVALVTSFSHSSRFYDKKHCYLPPVTSFLSLVRHARLMITNSFHGTLLSIKFNTPFFSIGPQGESLRSRTLRLTDLLDTVGLTRHFLNYEDCNKLPVELPDRLNKDDLEICLNPLIRHSQDFIINHLT